MLSLPVYDAAICKADAGTRLTALDVMTDIYVPSAMSYEIYSKIYIAMLHSLKRNIQRMPSVRETRTTEDYRDWNTALY